MTPALCMFLTDCDRVIRNNKEGREWLQRKKQQQCFVGVSNAHCLCLGRAGEPGLGGEAMCGAYRQGNSVWM